MHATTRHLCLLVGTILFGITSCQTDSVTQKRSKTSRQHAQRTGQTRTIDGTSSQETKRGTDPIRDLQYSDRPNYGSPPPSLDTESDASSPSRASDGAAILDAPALPTPQTPPNSYISPQNPDASPSYPYNPNYGVNPAPQSLQSPLSDAPSPYSTNNSNLNSSLQSPPPTTPIPSPPRRPTNEQIPYAIQHPTKPGVVISPYNRTREIRVGQQRSGTVLQDPETKQKFIVP